MKIGPKIGIGHLLVDWSEGRAEDGGRLLRRWGASSKISGSSFSRLRITKNTPIFKFLDATDVNRLTTEILRM